MTPARLMIADDEPLALALLRGYCSRIPEVETVAACTSGAEALETLARGDVDIAVLDIQMPRITGLEIARAVAGQPVDIIFVTAYRDYAIDGFRVHAADYLLKPVSFTDFRDAVLRVATLRGAAATAAPEFITVRSDYRSVRIATADILYIEGLKDYVKIHVEGRDRPVLTLMNLKNVEALLPEGGFLRVHRSYIVPTRRVTAFDRQGLRLDDISIPVGDTYRKAVAACFRNSL